MASQLLDAPGVSAGHFRESPIESVDRSYQHLDRCRRIRVGPPSRSFSRINGPSGFGCKNSPVARAARPTTTSAV